MTFPSGNIIGQVSAQDHGQSGSDLLAALMGSIQPSQATRESAHLATASSKPAPFSSSAAPTSPPADTQNYLLSLLNKPKPAQADVTPHLTPATPTQIFTPKDGSPDEAEADVSEISKIFAKASLQKTQMDGSTSESIMSAPVKENLKEPAKFAGKASLAEPAPKASQGLFTYVNPFDQIAASSPLVRTPKTTPGPSTASPAPAFQILKRKEVEELVASSSDHKRKSDERSSASTGSSGHAVSKRKLEKSPQISGPSTPLPVEQIEVEADKKETVAEALSDLGNQVDKEVQEAIARAESDENQAAIKKELEDMMTADNNEDSEEFEKSAQVLAKHIKSEIASDSHALDSLPAPVAEEVAAIVNAVAEGHIADVDDAADANVVDSWESADALESPTAKKSGWVELFLALVFRTPPPGLSESKA